MSHTYKYLPEEVLSLLWKGKIVIADTVDPSGNSATVISFQPHDKGTPVDTPDDGCPHDPAILAELLAEYLNNRPGSKDPTWFRTLKMIYEVLDWLVEQSC